MIWIHAIILKISSSKIAIYFWSGCHLEKVHKTTDKTRVITSSFSKTSVFTRPHVNTKTAFSKTSVFTRLHENGVFENLHSGERFRKPPFSHDENAVYVWAQRQNGEKNLRFQKYPHTCGRGGLKYRVYKKKLNKPEIAHGLCKAPQCTKFFIEIGCLGTDNVV